MEHGQSPLILRFPFPVIVLPFSAFSSPPYPRSNHLRTRPTIIRVKFSRTPRSDGDACY